MTESDALSTMCSVEEAASYDDVVRAFGRLAAELHPSERCVGGTAEAIRYLWNVDTLEAKS